MKRTAKGYRCQCPTCMEIRISIRDVVEVITSLLTEYMILRRLGTARFLDPLLATATETASSDDFRDDVGEALSIYARGL